MFYEKLNKYIDLIGCTGKEIADFSGLSAATVSRYRSGERTPKNNSDDFSALCRAISELAVKNGIPKCNLSEITSKLQKALSEENFNHESMRKKLNILFDALSVNVSELAKSLKFDASYISRIRSGQRRAADPEKFAYEVSLYILARFPKSRETVCTVTKCKEFSASSVASWLTDGSEIPDDEYNASAFLRKLDEFDLNEYISSIKFNKIKVPTTPFSFPKLRIYRGLEKMKCGELDFLRATALSKSRKRVFMYSDMPMDDMAKDRDFVKKYMMGLAFMLKKGLQLDVVHCLNRPFSELLLGLEGWIPLYMTGQISPFYLKNAESRVFGHFLNISGAAVLSGECIYPYHEKGRYILSNRDEDMSYYAERSELIKKSALPLMEIYREESAVNFETLLMSAVSKAAQYKSLVSSPPLFTADEKFLEKIFKKRGIKKENTEQILRCAAFQRGLAEKALKNSLWEMRIIKPSEEEFSQHPVSLSVSGAFCGETILYTYDEYTEHLAQTEKYSKNHGRFTVQLCRGGSFRNINIHIAEGDRVLISKSNSPSIHFVIRHPTLRYAVERAAELVE